MGNLAADPRLRNLIVSHPGAKRIRLGQDLHIAAAALVSQLPIATFNVKDFLLINSYYPFQAFTIHKTTRGMLDQLQLML